MLDEYSHVLAFYWALFIEYINDLRVWFNHSTSDLESWQIAAYTFSVTCFVLWLLALFESDTPLWTRVKKRTFKLARRLPWVQRMVAKELLRVRREIFEDMHKHDQKREFIRVLPEQGMPVEEISMSADVYEGMGQLPYKQNSKISGGVYTDFPPDLVTLQRRIFDMFSYSNQLHPDVFPAIRKMEAEVVRMICNWFNGPRTSCGTMTSGGTESILMAMLAYRNRARSKGIERPEIIVPITAHAAFWKAGDYFRIRVRECRVDDDTKAANTWHMSSLINKNTCCLVGSSPCFPYGTIDPLDEISRLGEKYNIPVHVDACLGSFLLPNMEALGYNIQQFDFRLPGVTSISCDMHKYGFCPKGSSLIMYRHESFLHHQYFTFVDWTGGIYATPTAPGSRMGVQVALTWATMLYYGRQGYRECTQAIIETTQKIREELEEVEGLSILGTSEVSVVAFGSTVFNPYLLMDELGKRGWLLNSLQHPPAFHMAVTMQLTKNKLADKFIADVKECVMQIITHPEANTSKTASLYGSATSVPDRSLVAEFAHLFLDACYSTSAMQPGKDSRKTSRVNSVDPEVLAQWKKRNDSYFATKENPTIMSDLMDKLAKLSEE